LLLTACCWCATAVEVKVRVFIVQGYHKAAVVPANVRAPPSRADGGVSAGNVSFF